MDDLIVTSSEERSHLQDLRATFDRLARFRCKLSPKKCLFFQEKVVFLGHEISRHGTRPDPKKVEAIEAFTPEKMRTKKDLQVFIHTIGYLRKFIRNFAQIAKPLTKYLKKGQKFDPGLRKDEEAREAFEELKGRLKRAPILIPPDYTKPFEIHCDAAPPPRSGLGAALCQRGEDGALHVVMYASRSLRGGTAANPRGGENGYAQVELECLAVVWALEVFKKYVQLQRFRVYTDAKALGNLPKKTLGRTQRWIGKLMAFDFEIFHMPGRKHGLPDGLSRFPLNGDSVYEEEEIELLGLIQMEEVVAVATRAQRRRGHGDTEEIPETQMDEEEGDPRQREEPEEIPETQRARPGPRRSARTRQGRTGLYEPDDFRRTNRARLTEAERDFVQETQPDPNRSDEEQKYPTEDQDRDSRGQTERKEGEQSGYRRRGRPRRGRVRMTEAEKQQSREYDTGPMERLNIDVFKEEQKADEKCRKIREVLRSDTPTTEDARERALKIKAYYFEQDGLLMRRLIPAGEEEHPENMKQPSRRDRALAQLQETELVVVPRTLRATVLWVFHGLPLTGHAGPKKTLENIRRYFYWPGMATDTKRRVQACHGCQMRKYPRPTRHYGPKQFVANEPWELVSIDIIGPLPESTEGNVKVLTMIDVFSKWAIGVPVPNERAKTVARALWGHLFCEKGFPKLLLSDRAKGFMHKALKWLYKHTGIAKVATTGLLPTGNSPVERFHKGLAAALTVLCNRARVDWETQLDSVLFAYRISTHESTGYSPYFLTTGRQPRFPIPVITGLRDAEAARGQPQFVQKLVKGLQQAATYVREKQLATLRRNERAQLGLGAGATDAEVANKRQRYGNKLKVGDLVSYWQPEGKDSGVDHVVAKKLQYRYKGPYRILKKDDDHFVINRDGKECLVNPNSLRYYHTWEEHPFEQEEEFNIGGENPSTVHRNPQRELAKGDFVIIRLTTTRNNPRPFLVGRVLAKRPQNEILIHFYGNNTGTIDGVTRPGWIHRDRRDPMYCARGEQPQGLRQYTSDHTLQTYTNKMVAFFGFQLRYDDRLPVSVKRAIHEDPTIGWTIPGKVWSKGVIEQ